MDDEELEETVEYVAGIRARGIDWLILGVALARGVGEAVVDTLSQAEILLCQQANFQVEQSEFADEARRQIESMTEGE